jgi:hypothetical protein
VPTGYMKVSIADRSQVIDLQRDALLATGVAPSRLRQDHASGMNKCDCDVPYQG